MPKLTNPLSTSESETFQITTYTSKGYSVDEITSGMTVTMTESSNIYNVDILLTSYQNSVMANYTFSISSVVPITEDDYLVITFPPEIELPWEEELIAVFSDSTNLIESISGEVSVEDATVTITFELADDVDEISVLEAFKITIGEMTNPNTTAATSEFTLELFDE